MKNSKFTPGPWELVRPPNKDPWIGEILMDDIKTALNKAKGGDK